MSAYQATSIAVLLLLSGPLALVAVKPTFPAPAVTREAGFAFLGEFSNEAERNASFDPNAEPQPPYRVQLWNDEKAGLVGHVFYPVQEADSPVARIQSAVFDKASGKISFQARIWAGNSFPENEPQYDVHTFAGILKGNTLVGTFSRQDEGRKYAAAKEQVTLKQLSPDEQLAPEGMKTLAQWEAEYSSLVTGRQP